MTVRVDVRAQQGGRGDRLPFEYANGRRCTGHVGRVEAYKADVTWCVDAAGRWRFEARLRSHYHVFCSDKANRAGFRRQDSAGLKFWLKTLPAELLGVVERTQPGIGSASR